MREYQSHDEHSWCPSDTPEPVPRSLKRLKCSFDLLAFFSLFFHSLIVPYLYKMSIVEPWPNFSPAQTPGQTHFQFSLNTSKALILSCTIPVSVKYGYVWFSICDLLAYSWSIYASLKAKNAAYCLLPKAPENTFESRSALMVQDVCSITLY